VLPSDAFGGAIAGVSCSGPSLCLAVGNYSNDPRGDTSFSLANVWNGRKWRLISSPAPGYYSTFSAVSCVRHGGCMAVGNDQDQNGNHNIAMRWNGRKWRVITMPGGVGSGPGLFLGDAGPVSVSCSRASNCMAVGTIYNRQHDEVAVVWNGKAWRLTEPVGTASFAGVSCLTPRFCMAVGQEVNLTLSEIWNGRSWRLLKSPNA
jgi:hypothetical protein